LAVVSAPLTLSELKTRLGQGEVNGAVVHAQVEAVVTKSTRDGKPFCEVQFTDSRDRVSLRAWNDSPVYALCTNLVEGACVEVTGDFAHHPSYGLEARRWTFRPLDAAEQAALLAGSRETQARQESDFQFIAETVQGLADPRLRIVCELFLVRSGGAFRRAAAARNYHHARRGGLVEHTAQMLRAAIALAAVYPRLNRDLLLAGVLFHDAGKVWENNVAPTGFGIELSVRGELLGHINLGLEMVNDLWRQLLAENAFAAWENHEPAAETVRWHLLHLIASHHGELAFGSPVVPKTPEACALHYIDNFDAKMEMVFSSYATAPQIAADIYDRTRPLPGYLIEQLPVFAVSGDAENAS
jgi:3'-5' exoribonuclease